MPLSDDQIKAIEFRSPTSIPIRIGLLPATWKKYRGELEPIVRRHPLAFGPPVENRDYDAVWSDTYHLGDHVDEWGCVWSNVAEGMEAIVTGHPVPSREDVHRLQEPKSVADGFKHGFMYLRLADLRGFEELMLDFAEDAPELAQLIDIVLRHNEKVLAKLLARLPRGEIFWFGDDLGMQSGLAMGAAKWRKYLKSCFLRLLMPARRAGIWVYMHTDGQIYEIIPDLVDCGIHVINPQIRANGLDNLVRVCKGKICVDLDLDRQMFPFATPRDIDQHVKEVVMKLGDRAGGLWLQAECAPDVTLENIEAIAVAMEKYRTWWS